MNKWKNWWQQWRSPQRQLQLAGSDSAPTTDSGAALQTESRPPRVKTSGLKMAGITLLIAVVSFSVGFFSFEWGIKPHISEQIPSYTIPEVRYKSLKQAEKIAQHENLHIIVRQRVYDPQTPEGYVIAQDPLPGLSTATDRTLYVVVSKGTEIITIPDLSGMSLRQARILLTRNNLTIGKISYIYTTDRAKNFVVTQSPLSNTQVSRGAVVDLLVSLGKRKVPRGFVMPDLRGQKYDNMQFWLDRLGFHTKKEGEVPDNFLLPGTILEQDPIPGSYVEEGQTISFTVSYIPAIQLGEPHGN